MEPRTGDSGNSDGKKNSSAADAKNPRFNKIIQKRLSHISKNAFLTRKPTIAVVYLEKLDFAKDFAYNTCNSRTI